MKRILTVFVVALVMAALLIVIAMPAFAAKPNASGKNGSGKKVAALSQRPNDGPPPGAYTPGS